MRYAILLLAVLCRSAELSECSFRNTPSEKTQHGAKVLRDSVVNVGTGFSAEQREQLGVKGLLPPRVESIEQQVEREIKLVRELEKNLQRWVHLTLLHHRSQTLFYALLSRYQKELFPIIYTPTVGEACIKYSQQFQVPTGMFLEFGDAAHIDEILNNWPEEKVDIIVVTDGSRILGLGDLGVGGMGIPVGKLHLYVAGGGFHPARTLPITVDMGTNNKELLSDPLYLGNTHERLKLEQYEQFFDVFMERVSKRWPDVLVQFEDFSNEYSFELLERYRHQYRCFNDDIQGTGAVVLAGFLNAVKASGVETANHRILFHGAGSASIGVAHQMVTVICEQLGITREQAYKQFWLVDSKGLVTNNRGDKLAEYKVPFARSDVEHQVKHLEEIIELVRPTAIIGLSGDAGAFSHAILKRMSELNNAPIVFALSNPTSKSECTAEEAFVHTDGRAIFASGSPFDAVEYKGKLYESAQGNNMYIFPGLGLGAFLCKARKVSDGMFIRAAKELAASVTAEQIASSMLYPSLEHIREISARIAAVVIDQAFKEGLAQIEPPPNLLQFVEAFQYDAIRSNTIKN